MRPNATLTIYLAEDDDEDAELFRMALGESHPTIQAVRFKNGLEVVNSLLKNAHPEPVVVFLDLVMPVLNGQDTLSQIRQLPDWKDRPVFILTGSEAPADVDLAYHSGCNAFLTKPVSVQELTRLIGPVITYWLKILNE
ncbi:response regulator [Larkinella ripae]